MEKENVNDYYRILGVSPNASHEQIQTAITRMRQYDRHGNYEMTINRIEEVLLDKDKRRKHDEENGYLIENNKRNKGKVKKVVIQKEFLDLDLDSIEEHRKVHLDHAQVNNLVDALREDSVFLPKNQEKIKHMKSFSFKKLLIFIVILVVFLLGFVLSKPILDKINGKKEMQEAVAQLRRIEPQIENYIRTHHVFPDSSLTIYSSDSRFKIVVDDNREQLILTFISDVADPLLGKRLLYRYMSRPNMTYWQCTPDLGFPENFVISECQ